MMPSDFAAEITRLERGISELRDTLVSMRHNSGAASTITINAGGIGIWLAVTCCCVMLAAMAVGGLWAVTSLADHRAAIQELRDGERAVRAYINTGILKPAKQENAK